MCQRPSENRRGFIDGVVLQLFVLRSRANNGASNSQACGWPAVWDGLLMADSTGSPWTVFVPRPRITDHAHHARKYADIQLPGEKVFRFVNADVPIAAHNMTEFYHAIKSVPVASLRHHLLCGDFSRWVGEVLGDRQRAQGLRKIERTTPVGGTPDRGEILAHIESRYLV